MRYKIRNGLTGRTATTYANSIAEAQKNGGEMWNIPALYVEAALACCAGAGCIECEVQCDPVSVRRGRNFQDVDNG